MPPMSASQPKQGRQGSSSDSWTSEVIPCGGGLVQNVDALTLGTKMPGAAAILTNYEPALDGGYRRINGYTQYDTGAVPGATNAPILGVKVGLSGIFAVRIDSGGDNAVYFSQGTGWSGKLNGVARPGAVTKVRGLYYSITTPSVVLCDGFNPAWKYDGSTETLLNSTGAPANPKFVALFYQRLALSGYGAGNLITLAAPGSDTDFAAADGAAEFNVGETILGMKNFRDELIIFCDRGIKKLTNSQATGTNADLAVVDVVNSIACMSGDTVQEIAGDLVYLAVDALRSYAGTNRIDDVELGTVSAAIHPTVNDLINLDLNNDQFSSVCVRAKSQYRLHIYEPSTDKASTPGLLAKVTGVSSISKDKFEWATTLGIQPYSADSDFTDGIEYVVFGDPLNGLVYRMEQGFTFDGAPIFAVYQSPDLTFEDATLRKVFQKATLLVKAEGDVNFNFNLILERGDPNVIQPVTIPVSQIGSVSLFDEAIFDTSVFGAFTMPQFKPNLIGSGFLGAFSVASTTSDASHTISAYQIQLSLKGRR